MLAGRLVTCVVLLGTSVVGCSRDQRPNGASPDQRSDEGRTNTDGPDLLEYVLYGDYEDRRLLLTAKGAARIDFRRGAGEHRRVSTVLAPTEGKEVERVVGVVDALIESDSARSVTVWFDALMESMGASRVAPSEPAQELGDSLKGAPASGDTMIRCRKAGHERVVWTNRFAEDQNFVWEGVRKEIEAVGLLELATAVDAYEDAQVRTKEGDREAAVEQYDKAVKAFMAWASSRCGRYGPGMIFEPNVTLSVQVPGRKDQWFEIHVSPERSMETIMKFSELGQGWVQETALELLPRAWQKCICGMALSRSGEAIVVAFPEPVVPQGWTWGLVVTTIPSELVEYLKAENTWAGEKK
jgi:hypothetical protein